MAAPVTAAVGRKGRGEEGREERGGKREGEGRGGEKGRGKGRGRGGRKHHVTCSHTTQSCDKVHS